MMNQVKTPEEIRRLRISGGMLAEVLRRLSKALAPGQTTGYLGEMAAQELKALGGEPAFLGYQPDRGTRPFPSTICISVNDEIVHGMPAQKKRNRDHAPLSHVVDDAMATAIGAGR